MSKMVVLSLLTACGVAFCGQVQAAEQRYPTTPGGGSDQIMRTPGNKFTTAWSQQVALDRRAQHNPVRTEEAISGPSRSVNGRGSSRFETLRQAQDRRCRSSARTGLLW